MDSPFIPCLVMLHQDQLRQVITASRGIMALRLHSGSDAPVIFLTSSVLVAIDWVIKPSSSVLLITK